MITLKDLKHSIMKLRRRTTSNRDQQLDESLITGEKVVCVQWSQDELLRENERLNKLRLTLIMANERLTKENMQLAHSLDHLRNTMIGQRQKN